MLESVSDEEVISLTHAILKRHGIDFTGYEPKSLKRRITRALSVFQMTSTHELWSRILKQPDFIHSFMDEISVGLTAMFRDPVLWKTLKRKMPKLHQTSDGISVWHAGCSTGEEVYTMAILLKELELHSLYQATATDISLQSIGVAQKGSYHKIKMLEYEANYKEYNPFGNLLRYTERNDNSVVFDKSLISGVKFSYHNLITDTFPVRNLDVVFCRNVMIYFDQAAKISLIKKFHQSLKPGGLFIIGFYDALLPLVDQKMFELVDAEAKIFRAL